MARSRGVGSGEESDDENLPWLEAADEEVDEGTLVSSRKLIVGIIVFATLLIGVVWLIYAQIARDDAGSAAVQVAEGDVPLIKAPDTPMKVKPENPGGLEVEGIDQTIYAAGGGVDPGGEIALTLPEDPVERPVDLTAQTRAPGPASAAAAPVQVAKIEPEKPAEAARPASKPAAPAKAPEEEPKASSGGGLALQLGAFSSQAKANEAWKSFTGRYSYLAGLEKAIEPLKRDSGTLYRLRAVGLSSRAQAQDLCTRLKIAGETCIVAN